MPTKLLLLLRTASCCLVFFIVPVGTQGVGGGWGAGRIFLEVEKEIKWSTGNSRDGGKKQHSPRNKPSLQLLIGLVSCIEQQRRGARELPDHRLQRER